MHSVSTGTTRILAGAGLALSLMFTAACDDDDPVVPPVPTELNISNGNNQSIATNTASEPLMVTLLDQNDDPLAGRTVTWTIVTGDGTLSAGTSVTDAQGVATVTFTSNLTTGTVTVSATVMGVTPATFDIMVQ
jgi:hypothetical protein